MPKSAASCFGWSLRESSAISSSSSAQNSLRNMNARVLLSEFLVTWQKHRKEIRHAAHVGFSQHFAHRPPLRYQFEHFGFEVGYLLICKRMSPTGLFSTGAVFLAISTWSIT
jgi:hypothetical protein